MAGIRDKSNEPEILEKIKELEKRGMLVRREKLARDSAFRVKSGFCSLSGKKIVFIDRTLSERQQLALLHDYLSFDGNGRV